MICYLTEKNVEQLLTMPNALQAVEQAMKDRALSHAVDVLTVHAHIPAGTLHMVLGAAPTLGFIGFKGYYASHGEGTCYYLNLFNYSSGKLDAIIDAGHLGMIRTGAASGVATGYMARKDAAVVAMIGAEKKPVSQLAAVCNVRTNREVRVFNRTLARAESICALMSARIDIPLRIASTIAEAVSGDEVINLVTKARSQMLTGELAGSGPASQCSRFECHEQKGNRRGMRAAVRQNRHRFARHGAPGVWRSFISGGRRRAGLGVFAGVRRSHHWACQRSHQGRGNNSLRVAWHGDQGYLCGDTISCTGSRAGYRCCFTDRRIN